MEWIKVEDGLPEDNKEVLVTVKEYYGHDDFLPPYVSMDYKCLGGKWYFDFNNGQILFIKDHNKVKILAWMYAPEPYSA